MKYIFVTGGVVSSLGKGLTAAALGADMFVGFLISSVGAIAGCWLGWKIYQRFLS